MDDKATLEARLVSNSSINTHPFQGDIKYEKYNPKIGFTLRKDSLNTAILSLIICGFKMNVYPYIKSYRDVFVHTCRSFLFSNTFSNFLTRHMHGKL